MNVLIVIDTFQIMKYSEWHLGLKVLQFSLPYYIVKICNVFFISYFEFSNDKMHLFLIFRTKFVSGNNYTDILLGRYTTYGCIIAIGTFQIMKYSEWHLCLTALYFGCDML